MLYDSNGTEIDKILFIDGIPLTSKEQEIMEAFIKGSVLTIITVRTDEPFYIRLLFGGENSDWAGTPLQALYDKRISAGETESVALDKARKDAGKLLRNVLITYENKNFKRDDIYQTEPKIEGKVYRYVK
jgi:hypothetical protein